MQEFVDYVMSFYGHGEIYDMGATREEVEMATQIRINSLEADDMLNDHGKRLNEIEFVGDSFDREYVRDIILSMRRGVAA